MNFPEGPAVPTFAVGYRTQGAPISPHRRNCRLGPAAAPGRGPRIRLMKLLRLHIAPAFSRMRRFVEALPQEFAHTGRLLHDGRNTIRAFETEAGLLVAKRYRRPNLFNRIVYTFFRKSKARRAYEHAERLRAAGIDTPQPVAWVETRRFGLLEDAWFVCRHTDFAPLSEATGRFPAPDTLPVLRAFARFAATLHAKGVLHDDFNHTNILYRRDAAGDCRFQLIDANRMRFRRRVSRRAALVNLRRLSCPAPAFLYVLDAYSAVCGWSAEETVLRGVVFRLLFRRRQRMKSELKQRLRSAG